MNILIIDSPRVNYVDAGEYDVGATQQGYTLEVSSNPSDEQLAQADGIIAFHAVVVDAPFVAKMHRCRVLVKATIGLDDVDVDALSANGILCSNIGSVGAQEVAEHALALILLAQRKLLEYARHTREGGWSWRNHTSTVKACGDTVLGLVGYGATGRALAHRASVLGYQLCFYDPWIERCTQGFAQRVTLESLLKQADVISLHLPLTPDSQHLLNDASFAQVKRGVALVNTARGGIVDTEALLRALRSGTVSMALLDVVQEEPSAPKALIEHERVLMTPHAAFYSERSLAELKNNALQTMLALLRGDKVKTLVNPDCVAEEAKGYA
ncbi:C-terminal binding protein [Pseudomonas coleopterorum]|uniref:C-terminal binding protein n=1 Tax=Pseudomonas coleopterorum TaxID=1605838 RepID=UPI002A6B13B2|nr:C-terminal binding protein [Pseudomonas coleopterorum]MDY1048878.1 C-terminal binding protein [Pseudomonas coleopterorum]